MDIGERMDNKKDGDKEVRLNPFLKLIGSFAANGANVELTF